MHAPPQKKPASPAAKPRQAAARPPQARVPASSRMGLPGRLKAGIENLSGLAMDDVRVHYNSSRPAQLRALAYTEGTEIHVGPGQERHLPHEAWHVVQQKQGRVRPTASLKAVSLNTDEALEREADLMGSRAAAQPTGQPTSRLARRSDVTIRDPRHAPVQGKFVGAGAQLLSDVSPEHLGVGGIYASFYNELRESTHLVEVVTGSFTYEQVSDVHGVLTVSAGALQELKNKTAENFTATYVGQLAHELSHARDHLIMKKKLPSGRSDERALAVLDTELRAWAVEAIAALQTNPKDASKELVDGWLDLRDEDTRSAALKSVYQHRKSNEVLARLIRYAFKELPTERSAEAINEWVSGKTDVLGGQIAKLAAAVAKALPTAPAAGPSGSEEAKAAEATGGGGEQQ